MPYGGQDIVELLNQKQNRATGHVSWIVEACHGIIRLHESVMPGFDAESRTLIAEAAEICDELNRRLSKFKLYPRVLYLPAPDRRFHVQYDFAVSKRTARTTVSEGLAALWLVAHIESVHCIRRCRFQECRKWFFAVTDHQKYCGDTCRKRDASKGESFKKQRAAYMRKYRRKENEREAESKQQAKRVAKEKR